MLVIDGNESRIKKKKVSKRNKAAWRKHTRVSDIEEFLEGKREDQILGTDKLSDKSDKELFLVDTEANDVKEDRARPKSRREKKILSYEPAPYELGLLPRSAVQDPIKRNRVRSKEERQHPARKAKDAKLAAEGKLRHKQLQSIQDRKVSLIRNKKLKIKEQAINFNNDLWAQDKSAVDGSWLSEDALRQCKIDCNEFKVKPPKDFYKTKSQLPRVEPPHPGLSYNPSLADHKDLIEKVVDKEIKMMKAEDHIARVTAPFRKKSSSDQNDWVEEVMQSLGMGKKEEEVEIKQEEDEEDSKEKVALALSKKTRPKMKTKKQRRTQIRLRDEAQQRKFKKVEKKKISDIYQLKSIVSNIDMKLEENAKRNVVKRQAKEQYQNVGTKRLAKKKFEEPLDDFTTRGELTGSLRKLRAKSTLLRDRFYSLQKRNILEPTTKLFKTKKRKIKIFTKRDHRIEPDQTSNQFKIINSV